MSNLFSGIHRDFYRIGIGTQTVTVTYRGVSETFEVTVLPKEVSFITATPKAAMNIIIGEDLDMSNVVITVNFTDGTSKVIESGYSLSAFDKETIGDQTVTLTYCIYLYHIQGVQKTFYYPP